jgi:hypothetical protein
MKRTRVLTVSVLITAMLLMTVSIAGAQGSANPAVLPPTARVQDMTLGEWSAEMFRALFEIPASQNPALGYQWTNCYFKRIGNVGLGVTYFSGGSSECQMPAGMILYVPIVGGECSTAEPPPYYGGNEEELRACVLAFVYENVYAFVDDTPVRNIESYFSLTPLYYFDLPSDNVLGGPAGKAYSVAHAYGFLLAPLSPGKHTIHVHGEVPDFDFVYDWVYHITVTD